MLALRDPNRLEGVSDPGIRSLLALRFAQLAEEQPYDPDEIGYYVLVEPGDTLAGIEQETGCWLVSSPFSAARYGEADYVPVFEFAEEHPTCYEVGFIFNDAGYGIVLLVPKEGIAPEVLDYCQRYATPAPADRVSLPILPFPPSIFVTPSVSPEAGGVLLSGGVHEPEP